MGRDGKEIYLMSNAMGMLMVIIRCFFSGFGRIPRSFTNMLGVVVKK